MVGGAPGARRPVTSTSRLPGADGAQGTRCISTYAMPRPSGTERTGEYTPDTVRLTRIVS
jgi:hypothetical protein